MVGLIAELPEEYTECGLEGRPIQANERNRLITSSIAARSKFPAMIRTIGPVFLLFFAVATRAQEAATPTGSKNNEVHLRAEVEAVVPLTNFSGEAIPVDFYSRFALSLRVESVEPVIKEFGSGGVVTFAIHSPSLLFAGEPKKGKPYDFYLYRNANNGRTPFFGLASHPICAEDNEPVGFPFTGWVGYTNTGEPVSDMTIEALTSPGKRLVATVKTDTAGRFSFPTLSPGRYYLRAAKTLVGAKVSADDVVTVGKGKGGIACLIAEGEAIEQSPRR